MVEAHKIIVQKGWNAFSISFLLCKALSNIHHCPPRPCLSLSFSFLFFFYSVIFRYHFIYFTSLLIFICGHVIERVHFKSLRIKKKTNKSAEDSQKYAIWMLQQLKISWPEIFFVSGKMCNKKQFEYLYCLHLICIFGWY